MELHEKASAALSWFENGSRTSEDTGRVIRCTPTDEPNAQWVRDLIHEAHGSMMPDDWRYEMVEDALDWLNEENDPDDYNPDPPVYNSERMRWLASHMERAGYVDEAVDELGTGRDKSDILADIALGWYAEACEVFCIVRQQLEALDDEDCVRRPKIAATA